MRNSPENVATESGSLALDAIDGMEAGELVGNIGALRLHKRADILGLK